MANFIHCGRPYMYFPCGTTKEKIVLGHNDQTNAIMCGHLRKCKEILLRSYSIAGLATLVNVMQALCDVK